MTLPFQSTRPVRGATRSGLCGDRPQWHFNPRAPCGARPTRAVRFCIPCYFNPRAPCGARLRRYPPREKKHKFQSTRPVRGATRAHLRAAGGVHISIHAPRAGRDAAANATNAIPPNFNPRAPCGARQRSSHRRCRDTYFNPRAPCGARLVDIYGEDAQGTFQSTRPVRGATG